MTDSAIPIGSAPSGVDLVALPDGVEARARVGRIDLMLTVILFLSVAWSVQWTRVMISRLSRMGESAAANLAPELFVAALMTLAGLYGAGLMLWIMFGSERLVIRGGRLLHSNAWLFGLMMEKHPVSAVSPFQTLSKDCGTQSEGCCCSFSTVDYSLTYGRKGRRFSVFSHLSRPAKDWLRDQLNAALAQARASGG